ncbi:RNA-binding protein [Ancylobacter lacus]|uniref:RNA-binding protein n=1 Tax=Ancylobacter lacus TaxID=2579970 RepID=UPI001BCB172B|nr:RNA-binding protein [Ancylobacter lacus]MBS7540516.1 RNA-binding protein [Ancylobacter lacus]
MTHPGRAAEEVGRQADRVEDQAGEVDDGADGAIADETDAGPAAARRTPARFCIATREVKPLDELLRFVVAPDGSVVPDLAARLPGRGAWLTATRPALAEAIRRKAFGRAFKGRGRIETGPQGPALATLVEALMERDALAALALANKAGQVVTGATKVAEALRGGSVAVLVHAADAAPDGVGKLDALARRVGEDTGRGIDRITCLAGTQLDLALGRANVVHAALLAHSTSVGFLARTRRLERWRA